MPFLGVSEGARGNTLPSQYKTVEQLLQESNKNLRQIKETLCCGSTLSNAVVLYQPIDCNGDPVGPEMYVLPTISVAKQDVNICNHEQITFPTGYYNFPTVEEATAAWRLSDNNDPSKVHSISISVIVGTIDLIVDNGATVTLPTGYTYNNTASSEFDCDFELTNFGVGARAIISTIQKA